MLLSWARRPESKTKQVNSELFNSNSLLTNWSEYGFCLEGWYAFSPGAPVAETSQRRWGCQDLSFTVKSNPLTTISEVFGRFMKYCVHNKS